MPHSYTKNFLTVAFVVSFSFELVAQPFTNLSPSESETRLRKIEAAATSDQGSGYLLGRLFSINGFIADASASFVRDASTSGPIARDSKAALIESAASSGFLAVERILLREQVYSKDSDVFSSPFAERLANSYFESNDFSRLIAFLSKSPAKHSAAESNRRLELLRARSLLLSGQTESAVEALTKLAFESPNENRPDDFSLEAIRELDVSNANKGRG